MSTYGLVFNDQFSDDQIENLRSAIARTVRRLQTAQCYGDDMRSSLFMATQEANELLALTLRMLDPHADTLVRK